MEPFGRYLLNGVIGDIKTYFDPKSMLIVAILSAPIAAYNVGYEKGQNDISN